MKGKSDSSDVLVERLKERIRILDESNCALAYRLISDSVENAALSGRIALYREFSGAVIGRQNKEGKLKADRYKLLESMGISRELAERVESMLDSENEH